MEKSQTHEVSDMYTRVQKNDMQRKKRKKKSIWHFYRV